MGKQQLDQRSKTKKDKDSLQKQSLSVDSRFKTLREFIYKTESLKQIFNAQTQNFYYCHVNMDWMEIRQTPPDVYSMAYETGLNLVGISVAMDTYLKMLNSGQQTYFLPHYYQTFYCPEKYHDSQQITFDALSNLIALIAEDLYMAGYYISQAGGGLGVYIPMIADQLEEVSKAEVNALDVLNKLNLSREFYFVEYYDADPTFGDLLFNNLTQNPNNTNFTFSGDFRLRYNPITKTHDDILESFKDDAASFFGVNQNIFNPQRFEEQMKPHVQKVYDGTTTTDVIYRECGITAFNTQLDTLTIGWIDRTVDTINFTFGISENRYKENIILTYINRKKDDFTGTDLTKQIWVIAGDEQTEQFFRAGSWFLIHPLITNYLYSEYLMEIGRETTRVRQLQPPRIRTAEEWVAFVTYYRTQYNYGRPLSSSIAGGMAEKIKDLGGGGSTGIYDSCS